MKPKLFLDEDVHIALAEALRKRGVDAFHVQEVGRKGKSDAEQLAYAVEHSGNFRNAFVHLTASGSGVRGQGHEKKPRPDP